MQMNGREKDGQSKHILADTTEEIDVQTGTRNLQTGKQSYIRAPLHIFALISTLYIIHTVCISLSLHTYIHIYIYIYIYVYMYMFIYI